jgi:hypothetical protein
MLTAPVAHGGRAEPNSAGWSILPRWPGWFSLCFVKELGWMTRARLQVAEGGSPHTLSLGKPADLSTWDFLHYLQHRGAEETVGRVLG